ncbi:hypothetical protein TARUN_881 [Trichoderma arundinaceum]|uniref:Uncharacterized protein n=1 Tax=Trichoderma arundinaceum TaxID=490622 RepID=A0A395NZU5_TRIAR|nr:hypothetical protein TARUN_881 [Trichoderma arundinaceum]
MSPDKGQGTIPLDDMRSRSNGHAVLRKERKATKSSDRDEAEEKVKENKKEADKSDDKVKEDKEQQEDTAIEVDLLDFSTVEVTEATSPEVVPARRYNLSVPAPFLDGTNSDDDFDMTQIPGSIYASAESFTSMESESFTPRRRLSDGARQRDELQEQAQLRQLQDTIARLTAEKEGAEREATRAMQQIQDLKHLLNSDMEEIAKDAESLGQEIKKLKEENHLLREELNDAQSHIFSLQPYRKDLTPEEVGRQYDDLVEQVQDWVQKFMDPWLDDYEAGFEALTVAARKQSGEAAKFKRTLHKYPDLVHGCMFPETDEDIIVAIVMRFLNDHIFQKVLYGSAQNYTEMVSFIETQMQSAVEPKRADGFVTDLFAVRTWTGESYNALMSAPQFKGVRTRRSRDLTIELADTLRIFCKKDKYSWFCQNMEERCIKPAMALYEKLQVSTHHFYLDIQPYISWSPGSRLSLSPEFVEGIEKLDCRNILHNRKAFNMARIDPRPTKNDLYVKLLNVCTVVPALYIRQIGQRDAIKAPSIVRKQQMLVAWGPEEKRDKFVEEGDQSLVALLYFPRTRKKGDGWLS